MSRKDVRVNFCFAPFVVPESFSAKPDFVVDARPVHLAALGNSSQLEVRHHVLTSITKLHECSYNRTPGGPILLYFELPDLTQI
jgi:hypothetical protein